MPGHRARKRFGQHFLADPGVIGAILSAVHATKDDVVVEIGPGQGAITAALFLREFIGKHDWAHLDIAGPASSPKESGAISKGGTGVAVAALVDMLTS